MLSLDEFIHLSEFNYSSNASGPNMYVQAHEKFSLMSPAR